MDELLKIGINSGRFVYSKDVYLTWIMPGIVHLIINNKYLKFDFDNKCFKLDDNPIHCINIENQTIPCCVDTCVTCRGWSIDNLNLGRYQSIALTSNIILAKHRNTNPQGKVLGIIEPTGIYKPESNSNYRFECLKLVTCGKTSRIWKVK